MTGLFHGFAFQLFSSIVPHHSVSFASFFHICPSLQPEIFEHLLYFQKFGGIPIFIPLPVSTGSQESSPPKSYRESPEHAEGTSPGGQEKFTSSQIQWHQEIQLGWFLGSLHQRDFAQFSQENSSAPIPALPGRASLCQDLPGSLQQPGLSFHWVFSFREMSKTP